MIRGCWKFKCMQREMETLKQYFYELVSSLGSETRLLMTQPGVPSVSLLVICAIIMTAVAGMYALVASISGSAVGNERSIAQLGFSLLVAAGRIRNLFCSPCDRVLKRYPYPNTCQIPFFKNISELYTFIWGYKTDGLFVEIGAYDGESFSNTSGLADLGWRGAYAEPIPRFAASCRTRHAGNTGVEVHEVCVGEKDGVDVDISTAGPFSSAVEDEVATVSASGLNGALRALGWSHTDASAQKVRCTTTTLDSFFRKHVGIKPPEGGRASPGLSSSPSLPTGPVDLLVIDVEGLEWPILKTFPMHVWRPGVVIVEIQELQARYRRNPRVQHDATALFAYFREAGYAIAYKDVVNTVFVHKDLPLAGGA